MIALVHNHYPDRNGYLIPLLQALADEFAAPFLPIAWQPPVVPHNRWMRLYRDWQYFRFGLAWARYRGHAALAWRQLPRLFLAQLVAAFGNSELQVRRRRSSFIETSVTSKHVAAWQAFMESSAEHLLVCEDDLVFKPDSAARFATALARADACETLTYIDLAGGFATEQLGIERLERRRDGDMVLYDPAVTNTACAYLLSRPLAGHFLAILQRRPRLRLVGIDWMINVMLMELRERGIACNAVHYEPTIFAHGSFSGDYVSWMAVALKPEAAPLP